VVKQQKLSKKQRQEIQAYLARSERTGAEVRRAQATLLVDAESGAATIRSLTKLSGRQAFSIRKSYLDSGLVAFTDKRRSNRGQVLATKEKARVVTMLKTKQPKDVITGCDVEHWTTGLLGLYIFEQFGKRYKSKTSEHLLFKAARFTWHCPGKVYEKADPAAKAAWGKTTKPVLKKHWQSDTAVILCEDEMVLTSRTTTQKVWLPRGTYPPIVETNNARRRKNFYGFLNLKTGAEHAFITDKQNMGVTAEVLTEVRKLYPDNKLVIIWDNCGWHRGSKVTEWIETDGNTETIHFPPYTPQLNPQEHVWKAGRKAVTHNRFIGEKLEEMANTFKAYVTGRPFGYELLGLKAGAV
jgi:transposase